MSEENHETQSDMDAAHAMQSIADNLETHGPIGELGHEGNVAEILAHVAISTDNIADAIKATLISPNEVDQNLESANVVDGLFSIARGLRAVASALSIRNALEVRRAGGDPQDIVNLSERLRSTKPNG